MKEIAIYVEGGGETLQYQVELRNGLDILLGSQKQSARDKKLGWKLVPCGGRDQAYKAFVNRLRQSTKETLVILLVDAEGEIVAESPKPKNESSDAENQRKLADADARKAHLTKRDPS